MKWRPIGNEVNETVYAWASDIAGYTVSLAYVGGDKRYCACFQKAPLHQDTCATPKAAQRICEQHYRSRG